jgi:hypothetical protein
LEIESLWIDSLCILQDSLSDWQIESAKMSRVYSNAAITIMAEAASDNSVGISASANLGRANPIRLPISDSKGNYYGSLYPQRNNETHIHRRGPLSSREWTMQEDFLSKRVIRYAGNELCWSCGKCIVHALREQNLWVSDIGQTLPYETSYKVY